MKCFSCLQLTTFGIDHFRFYSFNSLRANLKCCLSSIGKFDDVFKIKVLNKCINNNTSVRSDPYCCMIILCLLLSFTEGSDVTL